MFHRLLFSRKAVNFFSFVSDPFFLPSSISFLSFLSAYRPSDLSVADLQVESLEDLRLLNVRALFADRVDPWDANELQLQLEPLPEKERVARKTMSRWAD